MRSRAACMVTALAFVATGCETEAPDATGGPTASPARAAAAEADAAPPQPAELPVPDEPDPDALEELLRAAPAQMPPPTGPDGGTRVGSDTGLGVEEADDRPPPEPSKPQPKLEAGRMEMPWISSPATERSAREQYYWPLVQKCRGPDGKILPPDAITLTFTIRTDGSVDPATVSAKATDERYDRAAECAVREFSALSFTGPATSIDSATRVDPPRVISSFPSVD